MLFDGHWLDREVPGYRTLSVSGREQAEMEIYETDVPRADGTRYYGSRLKPRTITVQYQLVASTPEDFRSAYNKMLGLLETNGEEVMIFFNDERDKFFYGIKESLGEIDSGKLGVVGKINIYCANPLKYSNEEKTLYPTENQFNFEYAGTYKCYPKLYAQMRSDNGYIGYVRGGSVLVFGNSSELDTRTYKESVTTWRTQDGDMSNEEYDATTKNDGVLLNIGATQNGAIVGSKSRNELIFTLGAVGSGPLWQGASVSRAVGNADGQTAASNFELYWRHVFIARYPTEVGVSMMCVTGDDGRNLAGMMFLKNNQNAGLEVRFYINGQYFAQVDSSCDANAKHNLCTWENGKCCIRKSGDKFTYHFGKDYTYSFPTQKDRKAAKVTWYMGGLKGYTKVTEQALRSWAFRFDQVDKTEDIQNQFSSGRILEVDTSNGDVLYNGMSDPSLGAIGNQWEDFVIRPKSSNTIICTASSWATTPKYWMTYREAWL